MVYVMCLICYAVLVKLFYVVNDGNVVDSVIIG